MADDVVSRGEAKAKGLSRYFTGKSCKHGHVAPRIVANGQCIVCSYDAEKRYKAAHPDKMREKYRRIEKSRNADPKRREARIAARNKWIEENREQNDARIRRWRDENSDKLHEYDRAWRERNIEKSRDHVRAYRDANRHTPEWRLKAMDRMRRWEEANPGRAKENRRKVRQTRRARQYEAGGSYTNAEINALIENQHWLCAEVTCRADLREGKELDHYIPISKGGRNDIGNLQWLCIPCNRQKRDMMPDEWAKHRQQQREKGKIP